MKCLTKGGRLVLIKAVLSSIPTYFMLVFKMPVGVALSIEKLQRKYFWGDGVEKRKIHLVDCVTICKNKKMGGLGVGRMLDKNLSLLAKWVWRFVVHSLFAEGSRSKKILTNGLKVVVGNGERIRLWSELIWDSKPLKMAFPRIYALSQAKKGHLNKFGAWCGSKWSWNIILRRPPLDWEIEEEDNNSSFIPYGMVLVRRRWICSYWQLIRGRVMIKDVMARFGFGPSEINYVLCNAHTETIDHLVLHCVLSAKVWAACIKWWEIESCANETVTGCFYGWPSLCLNQSSGRAWEILFSTIVWSIWECRNSKIFNDKEAIVQQTVDIIKFRLVWWFKYFGKGTKDHISLMLLNVKDCCVNNIATKRTNSDFWTPLDSITAEIMVIHKEVEIVQASSSWCSCKMVISSDSMVAMSWVNSRYFGSLAHINTIYEIPNWLKLLGSAVVVFNLRASNSFTDSLAKKGSGNCGDFVRMMGS
ncbi:hypothetical protein Dsin_013641 [Dipteronia sinensis]|uniref:Reverse transcriptase zinc-binding domain-containing protein n=1 Tax=Dipteronia sinensis TaxID=43782 RepID=A0AAE0AKB4_9ROSI|nr:hypothetical protein Dsin_013641 [Dipteronia sinensis]